MSAVPPDLLLMQPLMVLQPIDYRSTTASLLIIKRSGRSLGVLFTLIHSTGLPPTPALC